MKKNEKNEKKKMKNEKKKEKKSACRAWEEIFYYGN